MNNLSRFKCSVTVSVLIDRRLRSLFFQEEFTFLANAKVELLEKDIS